MRLARIPVRTVLEIVCQLGEKQVRAVGTYTDRTEQWSLQLPADAVAPKSPRSEEEEWVWLHLLRSKGLS